MKTIGTLKIEEVGVSVKICGEDLTKANMLRVKYESQGKNVSTAEIVRIYFRKGVQEETKIETKTLHDKLYGKTSGDKGKDDIPSK